jgi:hypothetical protein
MGVAVSIVVFAVGAILRFATNLQSSSWNIRTIGDILMIVGVVGFLVSAFAWAYWDGFGWGGTAHRRTRTVIHEGAPPVYGPNGYARTTYDQAGPAAPEPTRVAQPGRTAGPAATVVDDEERSVY